MQEKLAISSVSVLDVCRGTWQPDQEAEVRQRVRSLKPPSLLSLRLNLNETGLSLSCLPFEGLSSNDGFSTHTLTMFALEDISL